MVQQEYGGNPFTQLNLKYSINYFHPRHVILFPSPTTTLQLLCQLSACLNRAVQDLQNTQFLRIPHEQAEREGKGGCTIVPLGKTTAQLTLVRDSAAEAFIQALTNLPVECCHL